MSIYVDVADAVVTELNSECELGATAVRKWIAQYAIKDLANLVVTVIAGPQEREPMGRGRYKTIQNVDVALQQKITVDNATIDAVVAKFEALLDYFKNRRLTTTEGKTITCLDPVPIEGSESGIALEHLEDKRCYTAVLRLPFTVQSA